jgi:hypothetical protein
MAIMPAATQYPIVSPITRRYGKLVFIEIKVNEAGPFWFAFDSGAHDTVIDDTVVQRARVKLTAPTTTMEGTGQGEVAVRHAKPITLKIKRLTLNIPDPLVVPAVSSADVPIWVHGIIGAALLESYVVEIDPDRPSVLVFDCENYQAPPNAARIPLIAENRRYFLMATLVVNRNDAVEHKLRIDTGSEDSVADDFVKKSTEIRGTTLGHGFGENYAGQSGLFNVVRLGPFTFTHVWGPAVPHPTIGMEIFRRFTTTFDVPHRALYLIPNRHLKEATPPPGS